MNVNQFFRHGLVMAAVAIMGAMGFVACTDKDDNPVNQGKQTVGEGEKFEPVILFESSAYVAPDVDADLKTALGYGIKEISDVADPNKKVLVVNKLTDLNEDLLKEAYELGRTIAVINPVKEEIDAFIEAHDWLSFPTDNISEGLMLFSFNSKDRYATVEKPEVEGDPVVNSMNRAKDFYIFLSNWMTELNKLYVEVQTPVPNNGSGVTNMEDFAGYYHFSKTVNYSTTIKYREVLFSDPDYMSGSGSMTVSYDIFTVHVYDNQPGAGDYYGVKMNASIANAGMWNGRDWNQHGAVYTRWCGFWCNYFEVETRLCYQFDFDKTLKDVSFPASGVPSPSTTVGQTSYEDSQSFTLSVSESIGGKVGTNDNKAVNEQTGQVSATQGWTWSHKQQRTVADVDIMNESTEGKNAKWKVKFNNVPKYDYWSERGFDLGDAVAYRSTFDLQGSWLWYDTQGKDNTKGHKYILMTRLKAEYEMQNWTTAIDDLWSKTYKPEETVDFIMPVVMNTTCGTLELVNNLKDGATISNVEVKDAKDGTVYTTYKNTIANGEKKELGRYTTNTTYLVTFKAKVPGGADKNYTYTLNPSIELTHLESTTLYALSDFTEQ